MEAQRLDVFVLWVAHTWPLFAVCDLRFSSIAYIAKCAMYAPPIPEASGRVAGAN
jgi:hypothetical protein